MIKRRALSEFEVNLSSLKHNFSKLKEISKAEPIFMVKGNAYGHGLSEVVNYCEENHLCSNFGLASIDELNDIQSSLKSNFWIFSELDLCQNKAKYCEPNIIPVISNLKDLKFYLEHFDHTKVCLKFDTGMHRIGFKHEQLNSVVKLLLSFNVRSIKHLMTHFSSSYLKITDESKTTKQFLEFSNIASELEGQGISVKEKSCSSSGAIEQKFGVNLSHIRPGLMMYGVESSSLFSGSQSINFKVLSSLKTKMIELNFYKAGTEIGYGDQILKSDGWIGVIPLGYADGLLTSYSKAKISCGLDSGILWGRSNMDMSFVYFKQRPKSENVVIWASNLAEFSRQVRSIPYQVLTTISRRVPKVYRF